MNLLLERLQTYIFTNVIAKFDDSQWNKAPSPRWLWRHINVLYVGDISAIDIWFMSCYCYISLKGMSSWETDGDLGSCFILVMHEIRRFTWDLGDIYVCHVWFVQWGMAACPVCMNQCAVIVMTWLWHDSVWCRIAYKTVMTVIRTS